MVLRFQNRGFELEFDAFGYNTRRSGVLSTQECTCTGRVCGLLGSRFLCIVLGWFSLISSLIDGPSRRL